MTEIAMAATPQLPELGTPGTVFFRGFLDTGEWVPDLSGRRALDTYERMRRSDPIVGGLLRVMKLPLEGATWSVEPATDDPADVALAAEIAENLFERMSMTWQEHLRQLLTHLDFGFYVCEKVWEIRDGRVLLRKLAPRLQRTIERWNLARDGGLQSVTQSVFSAAPATVDIPVDKVLVFTNDKEGANFQGQSALRRAYKPWFIKDQLERIFAIAAERHGVGIPVMKVEGPAQNNENVSRAEDILSAVRANEKGYVVEVEGTTFRIEGMGEGRALDVEPAIARLSREILIGGLAQFLALGGGAAGSFALSEDQSSLFMLAERSLAAYICDVHNRYLVPQLVDFNVSGVRRYPKLSCTNIETRNAEKLLNALVPAANAGLITADAELEASLRRLLDLPLRRAGSAREPRVPAPAPSAEPPALPAEEAA